MAQRKGKRVDTEYIEANIAYLRELSKEPDVKHISDGVYYKELKKGSGAISPKLGSVVSVYYTGMLINGVVFDSTEGDNCPVAFRLREVITGWQIALQQMHVGDTWRVYIPANHAYGKDRVDNIPGGSTLIFDVELLSIN